MYLEICIRGSVTAPFLLLYTAFLFPCLFGINLFLLVFSLAFRLPIAHEHSGVSTFIARQTVLHYYYMVSQMTKSVTWDSLFQKVTRDYY